MVAQKGKDLLIKIDMDGSGTFETVAGLRASRISFNAETVDVTNLGSAGGWRESRRRFVRRNSPRHGLGPLAPASAALRDSRR